MNTQDIRSSRDHLELVDAWRETFAALGVLALSPGPRVPIGYRAALRTDLYLVRSRQYVVVTPVVDRIQEEVMMAAVINLAPRPFTSFWVPDIPMIAASVNGILVGFSRRHDAEWTHDADRVTATHEPGPVDSTTLTRCLQCRGWYVCDAGASWACQVRGCDYHDNCDIEQLPTPISVFPTHARRQGAA